MELRDPKRPERTMEPVRASRFFMLKRTDRQSPLIPRPFSLYRQRDGQLEFLVKVMGQGTRALAESRPGQELSLVGPLGNGWPTLDAEGPRRETLVRAAEVLRDRHRARQQGEEVPAI